MRAHRIVPFLISIALITFAAESVLADINLSCATKKSGGDLTVACEKAAAARAKGMGCDVGSVSCSSGGSECSVRSLYCEAWVNRPIPEETKVPEPNPEPSTEPKISPTPEPSPTDPVDDGFEFPRRTGSRSDDQDAIDSRTEKVDTKTSVLKPTNNNPAGPPVVDPNRGCRAGFSKITFGVSKKPSSTLVSVAAPEVYCRADSFARQAGLGACAISWSRDSSERIDCSECASVLGGKRCEIDAAKILKSVNRGCESIKTTSKAPNAFEVRCVKTSGGSPGER